MKLVFGEHKNDSNGKNKLVSMDLTLHCEDEKEFDKAWEQIKDIEGVCWSGCPVVEDNGRYSDIVAVVKKGIGITNTEVYETLKEIRNDIEQTLKIGKYRK